MQKTFELPVLKAKAMKTLVHRHPPASVSEEPHEISILKIFHYYTFPFFLSGRRNFEDTHMKEMYSEGKFYADHDGDIYFCILFDCGDYSIHFFVLNKEDLNESVIFCADFRRK